MPHFLEEKVWEFQTRQIGIDDFARVVLPGIKDILVVLSHTASMYMGTERWLDIIKDIKETEASERFLAEHLDTLLGQFGDPELPLEKSVQVVSHAIEGIFRNCGLGFQTIPEGVYISVEAPSR